MNRIRRKIGLKFNGIWSENSKFKKLPVQTRNCCFPVSNIAPVIQTRLYIDCIQCVSSFPHTCAAIPWKFWVGNWQIQNFRNYRCNTGLLFPRLKYSTRDPNQVVYRLYSVCFVISTYLCSDSLEVWVGNWQTQIQCTTSGVWDLSIHHAVPRHQNTVVITAIILFDQFWSIAHTLVQYTCCFVLICIWCDVEFNFTKLTTQKYLVPGLLLL